MVNRHLEKGTLLQEGRYRIERFISSGGFGCTYEATYSKFNSRVAIKEFFMADFCNRDEKTGSVSIVTQSKSELVEKLMEKFLDEARAIYMMHEKHPQRFHPHIIRLTDFFEENGTAYYVMDYINGKSLHEIVKEQGNMLEQRALKYVREVADALSYVHSHSRLHLDVKPANIMIDSQDNAILIDFGASKHYDEGSGEQTSAFLGINTKGYAPVEQQNGSLKKFSPATDIYALGATLYKLLTGITPPDAVSLMSKEDTLPPIPDTVSENVRAAVYAAMQLIRSDRPQSIDEFLKILDDDDSIEVHVVDVPTDFGGEESHKENNSGPQGETSQKEQRKDDRKSKSSNGYFIAACVVVIAVVVGVVVYVFQKGGFQQANVDETFADYNGHEYVDLGLSIKWATCNIGASSPSDYGDYFAWGEIAAKQDYSQQNSSTYGKYEDDITGNSTYDVACVMWGGTWRLPTQSELDELIDCDRVWTTMNGHKGYRITGPNGNSIFLPAAGLMDGTTLKYEDGIGRYWGSTPYSRNDLACYLLFDSQGLFRDWNFRYNGLSVRAVSP